MPNIVEFVQPQGTLQPSDTPISTAAHSAAQKNIFAREAGAAIGRGIGAIGAPLQNMADRAEDHLASQMIGHGAATSATLWANLTADINNTMGKADPNDMSVGQGLKEKNIEPALQNFQKQFESAPKKAQDWALSTVDRMRGHFYKTIAADDMTRASVAVEQNIKNTYLGLSAAASNNPAGLPDVVEQLRLNANALIASHAIGPAERGRLDAEVEKMNTRLAQAAFDNEAQANPSAALAKLDRGDYNKYADGVTQAQWRKYAQGQQKTQDMDAKRDRQEALIERREASTDRAEEIRQGMYDPLSGRILRVNPKLNQSIINDPKLLPKDKSSLILWNETQYKRQQQEDKANAVGVKPKDDPQALADARKRVGDPDNPLTRQELTDLMGAEKLTSKTAHDLSWRIGQADAGWNAVQRPFKQMFAKVERDAMTSLYSVVKHMEPQQARERINDVETEAQRILRDAYARKEDMRPYLDPKSPQYVLGPATTGALFGNPAAALKSEADKIRGGTSGPATVGRVGGPAASSAVVPARISTDAEWANLKSGTRFIRDGKEWVKQ